MEEKVRGAWPPERWRDVTVLVAVSGGADSVALLRLLVQVRAAGSGRLVAAHFNHGLRGQEADDDQRFVEQLAASLGLEAIVGRAASDLAAGGRGQGLEAVARQARYDFLAAAAAQTGSRYVATAHTADDQVETVLLNVLRGTGLAGLAGIRRVRQLSAGTAVVRPLLDVTRREIEEFLAAIGQPFREDSTNAEVHFTRNRVRNLLIPLLEREFNADVRAALGRLSRIAGEANELLDGEAQALLDGSGRAVPGGVELELARLEGAAPALLRQALVLLWKAQQWPLQDMSFEKWEQLLSLMRHAGGETGQAIPPMFPGGVRVERTPETLRLYKA